MNKTRRHFSDTVKAEAVRRHLAGRVPVSDLAEELGVQPSLIHLWVKLVLDQAEKAFTRSKGQSRQATDFKDRRIAQLEPKLASKNEVIAEFMEDNVKSRKAKGEL